jgi:hypothetical protein
VNYEYITTVLCENKDKPKLQCNGKCHLIKELAKAAETEKPISSDKKGYSPIQEILFLNKISSFRLVACSCSKQEKNKSMYLDLYSYLKTNSVFHPPTYIS